MVVQTVANLALHLVESLAASKVALSALYLVVRSAEQSVVHWARTKAACSAVHLVALLEARMVDYLVGRLAAMKVVQRAGRWVVMRVGK